MVDGWIRRYLVAWDCDLPDDVRALVTDDDGDVDENLWIVDPADHGRARSFTERYVETWAGLRRLN